MKVEDEEMRVMHLLTSDRFSGAENVVCQIMSFFKTESDIEMIYCSPDGDIRESLKERNLQFCPMDRFSFSSVRKQIKKLKPDIIHAHDMRASVMAALAGKRIPLISHIHVNNYDTRSISIKALLYYYAAIKAKHIFWVSRSSYEGYMFHKSLKRKSEILMNIIDISALQKKAEEDTKEYNYDIVYLGRLSQQKNPQRLISIISSIINKDTKVRAAVIGTGELEKELRLRVKDSDKEDSIVFLGYINNPYKIIQNAKLLLMTSRWEGTPMCALEAMGLGVPIVSTPVDGMCDLVDNNITGYLSDDDNELMEKCLLLIHDTDLQERFSHASYNKAKNTMNIDIYKASLKNAYQKSIT